MQECQVNKQSQQLRQQLCQQNSLDSISRIISVKTKIPSPNRILPKSYQYSKPAYHFFSNFNNDIYANSAQFQLLYNQADYKSKSFLKQSLLIYLSHAQNLNRQNIGVSLKSFFLNDPEQLQFLSQTVFQRIDSQVERILRQQQGARRLQLFTKALLLTQFPFIELKQPNKEQNKRCFKSIIQRDGHHLVFEQRFQCSNILAVKRIPKFKDTYFLSTRFDFNTLSYGQWFYFKIKQNCLNQGQNNKFRFVICNMTKRSSMLGKSLKISVCRNNIWKKEGQQISYYKSPFKRNQTTSNHQYFYILEFSLTINPGQQIYVSYNEPYTYSRLSQLTDQIGKYFFQRQNQLQTQRMAFKKTNICQTYLKNQVECLSFTTKKSKTSGQKKIIFLLARAHPIETAGSFVIQGLLKQILKIKKQQRLNQKQKNQQVSFAFQELLEKFIIKIVPMLNPDGVILGNSRCNFLGFDLNRQWKKPKVQDCRQIYYLKKFILKYQGRIQMIIDLHGHSKKKNVFAYGLHDSKNPFATRQFPYLLSKLSPIDFAFEECRFSKISKKNEQSKNSQMQTKQGTARITLWKKLNIRNIFTIQNSYCSSALRNQHYNCGLYNLIGKNILEAISMYFLQYENQKTKNKKGKTKNNIELNLNLTIQTQNRQNQQQKNKYSQLSKKLKQIRKQVISDLKSKKQNITIGLQEIVSSQSQQQIRNQESQLQMELKKGKNKKLMQKTQSNKQFKTSENQRNMEKLVRVNANKRSLAQSKNKNDNNLLQARQNERQQINLNRQDISIGKIQKNPKYICRNQRSNFKIKKNLDKRTIQPIKQGQKTIQYMSKDKPYRFNTLSIIQIGWKDESQKLIKSSRTKSTQKVTINANGFINYQILKPLCKKQEKYLCENLQMTQQLKQKQLKYREKQKFAQISEIHRKNKYQSIQNKKYEQMKELISKINRIPFPNLNK